jgi:hypothetical protein
MTRSGEMITAPGMLFPLESHDGGTTILSKEPLITTGTLTESIGLTSTLTLIVPELVLAPILPLALTLLVLSPNPPFDMGEYVG